MKFFLIPTLAPVRCFQTDLLRWDLGPEYLAFFFHYSDSRLSDFFVAMVLLHSMNFSLMIILSESMFQ